jgi:AraC-like DNA-binding protein
MLNYHEHRPAPPLRDLIECLWLVEDPHRRKVRTPDRIVPDACPELIVHLADPFRRRIGRRWQRQPRAFLAGTLSRPWFVRAGARVRTLGIRFRPGAVTTLIPVEMSRATDREIVLADLIGPSHARDLVRRLRMSSGSTDWIPAVERWLLSLPRRRRPATEAVTRPVVRTILRTRGQARIDVLTNRLGVHPRRVERAFARDLGIAPKFFARIVRLNAALAALPRTDRSRGVDWALEAGYFDQAHLARDFRTVAGRRARAPREADGELARHFTSSERLLAYLAGK